MQNTQLKCLKYATENTRKGKKMSPEAVQKDFKWIIKHLMHAYYIGDYIRIAIMKTFWRRLKVIEL